jgi:hypothetical protein
MKKLLFSIISAIILTLALISCSGSDKKPDVPIVVPPQTYTVTFITNGGSELQPLTVNSGTAIPDPTVTRNYYDFEGWYSDTALSIRLLGRNGSPLCGERPEPEAAGNPRYSISTIFNDRAGINYSAVFSIPTEKRLEAIPHDT